MKFLADAMLGKLTRFLRIFGFDTIYANHTTKRVSVSQWGIWEAIASISIGAASLIGGVLIQMLGFQVILVTIAVVLFVLGMYVLFLPRKAL